MERKIKLKLHYKISNESKMKILNVIQNEFLFSRLHDLKERMHNNNNANNQVLVSVFV
jgi:hypothetical protein